MNVTQLVILGVWAAAAVLVVCVAWRIMRPFVRDLPPERHRLMARVAAIELAIVLATAAIVVVAPFGRYTILAIALAWLVANVALTITSVIRGLRGGRGAG